MLVGKWYDAERRRRRLEKILFFPDMQVPLINKGKSYDYFTTTYCCSISFSILPVQTSNFVAPPIAFDFSAYILKCVVLSKILSEASGRPSAFLSSLLTS